MMRIALIDDEPESAALIAEVISCCGHMLHSCMNSKDALDILQQEAVDMLILHWKGSGQAGLNALRHVRSKMPGSFPVLFVAGSGTESDIVAALTAGATDYVIKPVRRRELATRIAVLLQRAYPDRHAHDQLQFGRYLFEPRSGRLDIGDRQIILTQKEFLLALLFFRNLGKPLSRVYIQESIWPKEADTPSRTLDTHVSRVRSKLRLLPENGFRLTPVYSYGYRLEQLD
jgi:DNA-binding response OmpR family regulator